MSKNKGFKIPKDDLCYEEDVEEIGFGDYVPPSNNCTSLFTFTNETNNKLVHSSSNNNSNQSTSKLVHHNQNTASTTYNNELVHSNQIINITATNKELVQPITSTLTPNLDIFDNRTLPFANGSATSINGEKPTLKRTYKLRSTTIKKLNELIAIHSDPNTYVSTIVDIAIEFYYDFIKNEKLNN